MKLFLAEFQKIFTRKSFILLFIAALLINSFLSYRNECVKYPMPQSYNKIYTELSSMPQQQQIEYLKKQQSKSQIFLLMKLNLASKTAQEDGELNELYSECEAEYKSGNYLKYCSNLSDESKLYDNVLKDLQRVRNYKNNLIATKKSFENKTQMSIFSNMGTFSLHNVNKTLADIKNVPERDLPLNISQGINMAVSQKFIGTDILILLLVLFVVMKLITEEKSNGFFSLTHPLFNGQGKLGLAKIGVSAVSAVIIAGVMYLVNFILAGCLYGFGDLSRPIQAVSGFENSFMNINVAEYFAIFAVSKLLAFILISLILYTICTISKSPIGVYLSFATVFGIEGVLYLVINSDSSLGFFKYINIISFMMTNPLYNEYYNVNLFGFAVNLIPLAVFFFVIMLFIFFYWGYSSFCNKRICVVASKQNILSLLPKSNKIRGSVKIGNHELFKILVSSKGIFVLIFLIAIECLTFSSLQNNDYFERNYYKAYMVKLEGPMSQEKLDYISSEKTRFADLQKWEQEIDNKVQSGEMTEKAASTVKKSIEEQLEPQRDFEDVEKRSQYLQTQGKNIGRTLSFVYDAGYDDIFDKDKDTESYTNMLIMLIALIGSCAAVFSIEESCGLSLLIKSYCKGTGSTVRSKILISVLLAIPIFLISFVPALINDFMHYNIGSLSAPAQSLPMFQNMPANVSLLGCLLILMGERLVLAIGAALIVLLISQLSKNTVSSLIISTAVLASPVILHLMGVNILDSFCLNIFASKLLIVGVNIVPIIIALIVFAVLGALCILLTHSYYCRGGLSFRFFQKRKTAKT